MPTFRILGTMKTPPPSLNVAKKQAADACDRANAAETAWAICLAFAALKRSRGGK